MSSPIPDPQLDGILATQLLVAWAGEESRLGWWKTDLVDDDAGGSLLRRLLPNTHDWARFEGAREAARRVDQKTRERLGDADKLRSIFFLGFEIDEQVADRLASLKRAGKPPAEVLPFPLSLAEPYARETLASALEPKPASVTVPHGRELKGAAPSTPDALVRKLAAGLVPFIDEYPLPFYRWDKSGA